MLTPLIFLYLIMNSNFYKSVTEGVTQILRIYLALFSQGFTSRIRDRDVENL